MASTARRLSFRPEPAGHLKDAVEEDPTLRETLDIIFLSSPIGMMNQGGRFRSTTVFDRVSSDYSAKGSNGGLPLRPWWTP